MNPTYKAAIGVILVFILGWFGGALTTLIIAHHKMEAVTKGGSVAMAAFLDRQTTRGLKLNDDEKAKVYSLLLENVKARAQLQKTIQPQVWSINQQTLQQINGMLTSEQKEKFQDNLLRFESNFGRDPLNTGSDEKATPASTATNLGTPAAPRD